MYFFDLYTSSGTAGVGIVSTAKTQVEQKIERRVDGD